MREPVPPQLNRWIRRVAVRSGDIEPTIAVTSPSVTTPDRGIERRGSAGMPSASPASQIRCLPSLSGPLLTVTRQLAAPQIAEGIPLAVAALLQRPAGPCRIRRPLPQQRTECSAVGRWP